MVAALLMASPVAIAESPVVPDSEIATAASSAVRLGSTLDVLPTYPSGRCDEAVGGGLALRAGQTPNAVTAIGTSVEHRTLWAEHWGPAGGPQVLIVGQVHGNECSPLVFASAVRDAQFSKVGYWLIPTLNPDGYVRFSRKNAAGVDLNADGYWMSQPETVALTQFTTLVQPVVTIHVHSPNGFVGWHGDGTVALAVAAATGLRFTAAGTRSGSNWFLWQGQREVWPGGGAVLIELNPLVDWEAPTPVERGPRSDLAMTHAVARAALAAIDREVSRGVPHAAVP
jgi:hypothetical protein